jgi:hypothetical protein
LPLRSNCEADHQGTALLASPPSRRRRSFSDPSKSQAATIPASPITVIRVYDYTATHELLGSEGVAPALASRILLQPTTGNPQEAHDSAQDHDASYLDGAIQAAPAQMGESRPRHIEVGLHSGGQN